MNNVFTPPPPREPEDEGEYKDTPSEIIEINPDKDIWTYSIPLGEKEVQIYKRAALQALIEKIYNEIQPDFAEQQQFETMTYRLVVKKYEK